MSPAGQSLSAIVAPDALANAYRRALDKHAIISISSTRGTISYANDLFCQIMGYEHAELVGQTYNLMSSGVHSPQFIESLWKTLDGGETWVGEISNRTKDGALLWFDNIIVPLFDHNKVVTAHLSVRKNITMRKQAEEKLQQSERFLKNVVEVSKVGGWSLELDTQTLYWSEQTKIIHDLATDFEPSLDEAINYYAPEARSTITRAVEDAINTGQSWNLELPMITAKGRNIWVRAVGHRLRKEGVSPQLVGTFQDITERRQVEDSLRKEIHQRHNAEQLLRDVLETIPDAVAAYDDEDHLLVCNTSYRQTYAASAEAIVPGAHFEDIIRFGLSRGQYADAGTTQEEQQKWFEQRLESHKNPPEQMVQKLRDGTWLQVREHRSVTGTTVGVRSDITAMKRAEDRLRRFAEEDPLTGLFNRSRFCLALDEILADESGRRQKYGCVVLFDVDHFKPVNDAYGHDIGDEVLVEIAARMRSVLEPGDVGARLGGDEFVFVLTDKENHDVCDGVLQKLFDLMDQPIDTNSGPLKLSLSVGATPFIDGSVTSRQLLKQADIVQYRSKEQGRAQWCWFGDDDRANLIRDAHLGRALETSLTDGTGMNFHFAPMAGALDGKQLGYKAEFAWKVEGEILTPIILRSIAQKSGQSRRLCDYKLRKVFSAVGHQEARGISCGGIWMTVNGDYLKISSSAEDIAQICENSGVSLDQVTIAIDEGVLGQRSGSAIEASMRDLVAKGIHVAIDMFGSASSSISKLKTLGIDKVRLDPALTDPLADENADDAIVRSLIVIARTFGITVYASNVQSPAHAARLAALGCDGLEGSLIGELIPSDSLAEHLGALATRQLAGLSASMRGASQSKAEDAA